jgi:hypothetical protein
MNDISQDTLQFVALFPPPHQALLSHVDLGNQYSLPQFSVFSNHCLPVFYTHYI